MKRWSIAGLFFSLLVSGSAQTVPQHGHVFIVALENKSYSAVINSSCPNSPCSMPYLNGLAKQYAQATQYYANTHPSIGNYFMVTTGQIVTNSDGYTPPTGGLNVDNIIRRLTASGRTWKSYAENLPSVGYTGGDTGLYTKHHNPAAYFSDVVGSSTQQSNLVPFTQFAIDLANNQLPNYSFIVPNNRNNAHDCPDGATSCPTADKLLAADNWLKANIDPLIQSAQFKQDGLLVIWWDESNSSDTLCGGSPDPNNCGGRTSFVLIGPKVKTAFSSTSRYQHQSTLRMTSEALGLTAFPGASATAPNMGEFFSASQRIVSVSMPVGGGTAIAPVRVVSSATSPNTITAMKIYQDFNSTAVYTSPNPGPGLIDTTLTMANGQHHLTVKAWDSAGSFSSSFDFNACNLSSTNQTMTICTPTDGGSFASPVNVVAGATDSNPVNAMKIYLDGVSVFSTTESRIDTNLNMSAGSHRITVKAWDGTVNSPFSKTINITVP